MSTLPREIRKQLKNFISKTTDETLDLVVNLTGKYINEKEREKLKREAEFEIGTKIEESIGKAYQIGLELREEYLQKKLETTSLKEKFYSVTDTLFRSFMPDIPHNIHAIDHLFQVCEELSSDFRFNWRYLKDTNYIAYLQGLERLMGKLKAEHKINKSWEILNEFKDSEDFYLLLQATLQRLIKHYEFLARDFTKIKKRQVDKYLEIYPELSGHYEKLISLIAALIQLSRMEGDHKYKAVRKSEPSQNIRLIRRNGLGIFVSGFNRKIRNAIVHKTCKVDILKETVEFIDRNKTITLTFKDVQEETRELSALLLVLPHIFVSIFCLAVLSLREILDNIDTPTKLNP